MTRPFDVVATRLDVAPHDIRAAAALLSEEEVERARRFRFDTPRRRFIVARGTLRRLLAVRLDVSPNAIELVYGERGKPALGGRLADSGLHFNVAHCDDVAVYAFVRDREIGVDVEAVRWFADADDIASRFFSLAENRQFARLAASQRPLGFFNCWTRKEAFIKALGDGLYCPLEAFDVTLAPGEPARILRIRNAPGEHRRWSVHSFNPLAGFLAAVVVENS